MGRVKDAYMEMEEYDRKDWLLKEIMEIVGEYYTDSEVSEEEREEYRLIQGSPTSSSGATSSSPGPSSDFPEQEPPEGPAEEEPAEEEAPEEPVEEEPAEEEAPEEPVEEEPAEEEAPEEPVEEPAEEEAPEEPVEEEPAEEEAPEEPVEEEPAEEEAPEEPAEEEAPEETAEEEPAEEEAPEEPAEEEPAEEEAPEEPALYQSDEMSVDGYEDFSDSSSDQGSDSAQARCSALEELLERNKSSYIYDSISKALIKLTERGLHEEAKVLLKYGADPNYRDRRDYTPLHVAVNRKDTNMVEILMSSGASASERCDYSDETLLVSALLRRHLQCVRIMLENGADVNAKDDYGLTPLMQLVTKKESLDILELLLEKGARPTLQTNGVHNMESVLSFHYKKEPECGEYDVKLLCLLLRHGFRIHCCGNKSLLELSLKAFDRLFPLAALLWERVELCVLDHHCQPQFEVLQMALHTALRGQSKEKAGSLVDKANKLLDLVIERPPMQRFTLSPLQDGHQGTEWALDTVPASLQSLSCALIRRVLLPRPLQAKIEALPVPELIQDLLQPLYTVKNFLVEKR